MHHLPLQNKEINTQNPFDIALEVKAKKIKISRDFRVFVLRPMPENENSEIAEILQKGHDTEMWECSFKSSWNAVQMTSNSKSFSHIANLVAGVWVF